ncbi:MAG: hypothetical protein RLP44_19815 [Aggregatilineales bacterium]
MKKHALICNLMYKLDSYEARSDMMGLLKYMQYRNDRDKHIPQDDGFERWYDRGLGNNYRVIGNRLMYLAGDRANADEVLVRMMVVSPHPDLIAELPEWRRARAVKEISECMVEQYFEAQDLPVLEYSFVIHDPETEDGTPRLHSHILLPATVPDMEGRRHYDLRRQQMPVFHEVRDRVITDFTVGFFGVERAKEIDLDLLTDKEKEAKKVAEPQPEIVENEIAPEPEENLLDRWFGPGR